MGYGAVRVGLPSTEVGLGCTRSRGIGGNGACFASWPQGFVSGGWAVGRLEGWEGRRSEVGGGGGVVFECIVWYIVEKAAWEGVLPLPLSWGASVFPLVLAVLLVVSVQFLLALGVLGSLGGRGLGVGGGRTFGWGVVGLGLGLHSFAGLCPGPFLFGPFLFVGFLDRSF